jgi:hypothetical protein
MSAHPRNFLIGGWRFSSNCVRVQPAVPAIDDILVHVTRGMNYSSSEKMQFHNFHDSFSLPQDEFQDERCISTRLFHAHVPLRVDEFVGLSVFEKTMFMF